MQTVSDPITLDHDALKSVAERSRALLLRMDTMESLVEPMANFAIAVDRLALTQVGEAAKSVLTLEQKMLSLRTTAGPTKPSSKSTRSKRIDDVNGSVISAAQNAQTSLEELYHRMKATKTESANPDVHDLCNVVLESCSRMFEAAESLRWERLEDQADSDLKAGRVKKFSNAADLMSHLSKLAN